MPNSSDSINPKSKKRKPRSDRDGAYRRPDRKGWWISYIDSTGKRKRKKVHGAINHKMALNARNDELTNAREEKRTGKKKLNVDEDDFEKACQYFLKEQKAKIRPKSYQRLEAICRLHLIPYFSGKASLIDYKMVNAYLTMRLSDKSKVNNKKSVSEETVLKELTILKQLLKDCVSRDVITFNPAREIKFEAEKVERVRYLQPEELKKLLEACSDWLKPIVIIAVSTGMRRGEILSMKWADVDLDNRRIILSSKMTKSRKLRIVYLNNLALRVLISQTQAQLEKLPSDIVFNEDADYVTQQFRKACETAKLQDFRFHDLRHTAASWLRMNGADIGVVADLLGHSDLRQAKRYQHLSPEFLLKAVSRLDQAFEALEIEPADSRSIDSGAIELIN